MKFTLLLVAGCLLAQDPMEILKRTMDRDARNLAILDTYMYERNTNKKVFDKDGKLKEDIQDVHEVFRIDGTEIERLLMKKGKALSAKEEASERKRVDKEIARIKSESPKERAKRRGETDKDKREEIEARREVLEAFNFAMVGEKEIAGRKCWGVRGDPKPGFVGKGRRAEQLRKVSGVVWIDHDTYELTRFELNTHDTISVGWFLIRLQPGTKVRLDQTLVNNEVWLPKEIDIRSDARVLGKLLRVGIEIRYDKFRKFTSDSKLVLGEQ